MEPYLKLFKNHAEYEEYKGDVPEPEPVPIDPSMFSPPPMPNHVILYKASEKLPLNTNTFVPEILIHDFKDGEGTIIFDGALAEIPTRAFNGSINLTSIEIPNGVTTIGMYAFYGCINLASVTVYATTPPILGVGAFDENASERKIYVPDESLGAYKTGDTWDNYSDSILPLDPLYAERWVDLGDVCIDYSLYKKEQLQVSHDGGVTWENSGDVKTTLIEYHSASCGYAERWVEDGTICDKYDLYVKEKQQISYNSGTTWEDSGETRKGALIEAKSAECGYVPGLNNQIKYYSASKLSETTSDKTSGLHTNAFGQTITSHTFSDGIGVVEFADDITTVGSYAFYGCGISGIDIPDSVTSIGYSAFYNCTSLTSMDIPDNVTTISDYAFNGCGLTSCTIGTSVISIGNYAFTSCRSLTSIVIPNSVTSIGPNAFYGCSSLTSCTIGNGVTSIGGSAFYRCTNLTSVTVNAIVPPTLGGDVFSNTNNCPIYVPSDSVNTYKSASGWSSYASRIQPIT
jgi:hypothetical protein